MIASRTVELQTRGQGDVHDLTASVAGAGIDAGVTNGLATVFVVGSPAGITTLEFEPGVEFDTGPHRRTVIVQLLGE